VTAQSSMLPLAGYLRLSQIIGRPKANPPVPAIIPVSASTWWAGVKSGKFPAPVKLSVNVTAWKVSDIRALMDRIDAQEHTEQGDWEPKRDLASKSTAPATKESNFDPS
jgi:predicted DNA-binding transcriptional regulator AlpA